MNCVRFVEALGVPQDGAAGVFLLLKDTLELLEQSENVQDILPITFVVASSSVSDGTAVPSVRYGDCVSSTEKVKFIIYVGTFLSSTKERTRFVRYRVRFRFRTESKLVR